MDDKYQVLKMVQRKQDADDAKTKYQAVSKKKLNTAVSKRVKTTMIGALATIEENFGFLWEGENGKRTKEQEQLYNLFQETRSAILDKGNDQIRQIEKDLDAFNIETKKIYLEFRLDNNSGKE